MFTYAGDSTFFRIVSGAGEIWTLNNGLVQKSSGIVSPTIEKKFTLKTLVAPDTIAVVDAGGLSMALVSLASGAVTESSITSDVITATREASSWLLARASATPRMATPTFITAIGGDQTGAVYATVLAPHDPPGVIAVIRIASSGAATTLGKIRLPMNSGPFGASNLVVSNSELGVLSRRGAIAWYSLPLT